QRSPPAPRPGRIPRSIDQIPCAVRSAKPRPTTAVTGTTSSTTVRATASPCRPFVLHLQTHQINHRAESTPLPPEPPPPHTEREAPTARPEAACEPPLYHPPPQCADVGAPEAPAHERAEPARAGDPVRKRRSCVPGCVPPRGSPAAPPVRSALR